MNDKPRNTQGVQFDKAELIKGHPELHHYTTENGLRGIIKTKTIWATHFSELNDATEVKLLQEPLIAALAERCRSLVLDHQRANQSMKSRVDKFGGVNKVAAGLARDFVRSAYQVTFDSKGTVSFGSPFIASFCSHAGDQAYEKENGLLSQWRGYGRNGGYCVVFDTKELVELLAEEFSAFDYVHMDIDAARYGYPSGDVSKQFTELVDRCSRIVSEALGGDKGPSMADGLSPFLEGATLFKHQAFYEEREIRIVAMPSPKELQDRVLKENPTVSPKAIKEINIESVTKRHFISLFDGFSSRLPIKRIIVGPSRNAKENILNAISFVGNEIPIRTSATPYIG